MKLIEALKILQAAPRDGAEPFEVTLACGFTPLHLQTFLAAYLQQAVASRRVIVHTGLYGNLVGTVEAVTERPGQALATALEWADLDPRLGFRASASWGPASAADVIAVVRDALARLATALERLPRGVRSVIALPTLPLPPLFHTPGWQTGEAEGLLLQLLADFRINALGSGTVILHEGRLAESSPPAQRFDLKADLLSGAPYSLAHAEAVGAALARAVHPAPPKKGLITDLDDTLWGGIVGDAGPAGIGWDLSGHHGLHGIFQRLLAALAEEGVLLAVASKNDAAVVKQAFARDDILISPERLFPLEVHWNAKSGSVERILRAWNIGADSVVFVDDSPMELAEVAAAHPGIETIQFPPRDPAAAYAMFARLRDLFGKPRLAEEDAIRLSSIRQAAEFDRSAGESAPEAFLEQLGAQVTLDFPDTADDARALELVNKTNQFNLNGIRYTEADWERRVTSPGAVLMVASYADRFGPLGKIAVLQGQRAGSALQVDVWVMSCRAFARRIEYQCLRACFTDESVDRIELAFTPTAKNGPTRDLLRTLTGAEPEGTVVLTRERFEEICPALYHTVVHTGSAHANG